MLRAWEVYFMIKKAIKKQNIFILHLLVRRYVQMSDYNVMLLSLLVVNRYMKMANMHFWNMSGAFDFNCNCI
jgi:type IV secretory pathway VirB3-like protein